MATEHGELKTLLQLLFTPTEFKEWSSHVETEGEGLRGRGLFVVCHSL